MKIIYLLISILILSAGCAEKSESKAFPKHEHIRIKLSSVNDEDFEVTATPYLKTALEQVIFLDHKEKKILLGVKYLKTEKENDLFLLQLKFKEEINPFYEKKIIFNGGGQRLETDKGYIINFYEYKGN